MREYIEGLKATDDVAAFMLDHRKETIRLALIAVVFLAAILLFMYRGGSEVEIADTARPLEETVREEETEGAGGTMNSGSYEASGAAAGAIEKGTAAAQSGEIFVDIGGAVESPMLAKLPAGSRVEDAIQMAGGLSKEADLTTINRAEVLVDGQKIYIPKKGETGSGAGAGTSGGGVNEEGLSGSGNTSGGTDASGKVNINTADLTQLQTITGVGPVTAQKILDYRSQVGSFRSIEDLKNISGIGDKTFEKMKDQVVL